MRIRTLQLENIRSHSKTTIPFVRGFNCLVGGLGRGKSSVLYAIDFVLFGDPLGRSYEYLLKEGSDGGKVTATFVHSERTYTLHRALRRHGKGIGQDMDQLKFYEDGKLIASVKNEAVAEQLKALTGLDKGLFREVVWVRQEHLKELLDATPRQRQTKLDQLFGLSDYEIAWSLLAQFQRDYKVEKGVYERDVDVVGVDGLQAEYNRAVEEFSSIENQIQDLGENLTQAESTLKDADSRLESLEELRKQTESLRAMEIQLQTNITNIKDTSASLVNEIEMKETLVHDLKEHLKTMEAQEKSQRNKLKEVKLAPHQTIEELRRYLFTFGDQITSMAGEQKATKREIVTSKNRISSLIAENKCPLCLQKLTGDYKRGLLERLREENVERNKKLSELQKNLCELESLHSTINVVISDLQPLIPRIKEIKGRIAEEQQFLDKLSVEFENAQQQEKRLRSQLNATSAEIAKFDVSELESARKLRDAAFEHYSATKSGLEMMERRKRDIALRIDNLKERLDYAQQKIERMEKIGKLLEIVDSIRGAYRSIQPKLRSELVTYLERTVQQVLDGLVGDAEPTLIVKIDETYTPFVSSEEGYEREVSNLSGGERTLLAFAYRIGLGQLIMQSRT
ncbi:MAG: SMC family ATPase, partial [Candidatus Bathyarchaeota archaeon]|nr:SMC family ATPase [Candidatus Bathyarchaeota archaeon]